MKGILFVIIAILIIAMVIYVIFRISTEPYHNYCENPNCNNCHFPKCNRDME